MNYIILDMEWNQPAAKACMITKPVVLTGEIIRIGAVKLDENLNELGRYHICVIPKYYKKMNSAVGKLTGLANASITYGLKFPVAYDNFRKWCGDDCCILTWGGEDEKILRLNLQVHGMKDDDLPSFYDLQIIMTNRITKDGRQYGVAAALEYYELPADLKQHDALNDAIYTARIAAKMDFVKYLGEYGQILEEIEKRRSNRLFKAYQGFETMEAAFRDKRFGFCRCPVCRKIMKMDKYSSHSETLSVSKAVCKTHGEYYIRLKVSQSEDGTYSAVMKMSPMNADSREICENAAEETV